jgi:hypothetical protein
MTSWGRGYEHIQPHQLGASERKLEFKWMVREMSEPLASPCSRFQGSIVQSSPVRYAANSGEWVVGSSHGVSIAPYERGVGY